MKFLPALLLTAFLTGCATYPPSSRSLSAVTELAVRPGASKMALTPASTPKPALLHLPLFTYPVSVTNYFWTLESSGDLKEWHAVNNFIVESNGTWTVEATTEKFFRMRGDAR